MLYEPTSLASVTGVVATALQEEYGIEPGPVFAEADLELPPFDSPQLRYPQSNMRRLWAAAREASGDDEIGLKTGWYVKPGHLYALGYSFMASSTLLGANACHPRRVSDQAWVAGAGGPSWRGQI